MDVMTAPKFTKNQQVYFIGGVGIILGCKLYSSTWNYILEMEMGSKEIMGKVGIETRLMLHEEDTQEVIN
ncbi:MAG: hypothetical protein KME05_21695 [Gloeocapsa sp. UFS-A4-WI-NPMV-4B04]|jgi:hypothetical protein|nr:hypothetical protein [Gloeocapsa sp. UFS-A4-WI-NPMV-4B04]